MSNKIFDHPFVQSDLIATTTIRHKRSQFSSDSLLQQTINDFTSNHLTIKLAHFCANNLPKHDIKEQTFNTDFKSLSSLKLIAHSQLVTNNNA